MFTMKIVDSDAFLDMPLSAQCLYFHLNMRADDDGFIGNPKKIMRMIGSCEDDFKLLLAKKFLIIFENNVVVIKHWWMHNTLSKDRYHETSYTDEKQQLKLKDNKSYTLEVEGIPLKKCEQNVNKLLTNCEHPVNSDKDIDKDIELVKDSEINISPEENKKVIKPEVELRNLWNDNYKKLFGKKPDSAILNQDAKRSYWSKITRQIQNKLKADISNFNELKMAIIYATQESWILEADYSLSAILSDSNIANSLAQKPHSKAKNKAKTVGKASSDVIPDGFSESDIPF